MNLAADVAEQAAVQIMDIYRQDDFDIQLKTDKTPVTQADLLAHHLIVEKLQLEEDIPILSEESIEIDWQHRKNWQTYWLIDPLDGTKEFVDRNDEFTVNIALIHHGQPIVGVVQAPALDQLYMAARGIGAFKRTEKQGLIPIRSRSVPEQQITLVIGRRTHSASIDRLYKKLPCFEKIHLGSSLKTCLIAEGKADLYPRFGKTSEWDTAAAQCILECAGGAVTDMQMSPLRYNTKESLLNPAFIAWGDSTVHWQDYLPSTNPKC